MRIHSLLTAALLASTCSLVQAQTYSNVIAFGDSLSDNGNTFAFSGFTSPPAPYFNGRYSNGQVWTEILAGRLHPQAGANGTMNNFGAVTAGANTNFSFGGARVDSNPNSNGPLPNVGAQINAFSAYGGTYGATSLVTLWAGANDIFQSVNSPATAVSVTTASATIMGQNLNLLASRGARNVVIMNLPDLGATPAYIAGGAPAIGLGTFATNSYNTALAAQVAAARTANPTMNIISVNANAISSAMLANPAAFGFSNTTSQCVMTAACVTGNAATQAQYFFWDSVHPTTASHAVFASIVQQYTQYGNVAATTHSLNEVGFQTRLGNFNRSFDRASGAMPSEKGEMKLEASVDIFKDNGGGNRTAYSGNSEGAHVSYAKSSSQNLAWGLGANAQFGTVTQGLLKYSPVSLSLDGWMSWRSGMTFVNVAVGTSYDDYGSYSRSSGIGSLNMSASPTGSTMGAALEIGQGFKAGAVTYTPSARFTALRSNIGAYNESGLVAPLAVSARSLNGLLGAVQMRADMPLTATISGNLLGGYQALISSSGNNVTAGLADNTVTPFTTAVSAMKSNGVYAGAGLAGKYSGVNLALDYRLSMLNGAQHRFTGGIKLAF